MLSLITIGTPPRLRHRNVAVAVLLLALTAGSGGAAPPRGDRAAEESTPPSPPVHPIGRAPAPPHIDGRLGDACWDQALRIDRFLPIRRDSTDVPSTVALIAHDTGSIYLAMRCDEPDMARLRTRVTDHDGPTWQDDSIELFLDSAGQRASYGHIAINAAGVVRDAWREAGGAEDLGWDSGVIAVAMRDADGWTVEASIPLHRLIRGETGAAWSFQIVRTRPAARQHLSMLSTHALGYHVPHQFEGLAGIHLSDWSVELVDATVGDGLPGRNLARVRLRNKVEQDRLATVSILLGENVLGEQVVSVSADSETTCELPWRMPAQEQGRVELLVSADGRPIGGVDRPVEAVTVVGAPARTSLVFARGEPVVVRVPIALASLSRRSAILHWELRDGSSVAATGSATPLDRDGAEVRLHPVLSGRYTLHLRLQWPGGGPAEEDIPLYLVESPFSR